MSLYRVHYPEPLFFGTILPNCPHLESLILPNFTDIFSDSDLSLLNQYCSNMTQLDMECCFRVSEAAMIEFILKHPLLENLRIPGNLQTTGIFKALSQCQNLRRLRCVDGPDMTDENLIPIIQNNSKLDDVHFSEGGLTERTLDALAKYCPLLETVGMSYCPYIYQLEFVEFVSKVPSLKNIEFEKDGISPEAILNIGSHPGLTHLSIGNIEYQHRWQELFRGLKYTIPYLQIGCVEGEESDFENYFIYDDDEDSYYDFDEDDGYDDDDDEEDDNDDNDLIVGDT